MHRWQGAAFAEPVFGFADACLRCKQYLKHSLWGADDIGTLADGHLCHALIPSLDHLACKMHSRRTLKALHQQ
jgi:hypothetical protein